MSRVTPKYFNSSATIRDRWMISYVDVLTILLMFFLGIAAQSLHLQQQSASPKISVPAAPRISQSREALLRARKTLEQYGIDLRIVPQDICISLPQAVLFASGQERVNPEALPIVSRVADILRDVPNEVKLVGYADSIPIHNQRFRSNWALATARSLNIQELLSERYGIPESRLSIASYGSYRPNRPNDTPDGRAQNRRVEILILDHAES